MEILCLLKSHTVYLVLLLEYYGYFVPKNERRFFRKKLEEWERIKSAIGRKIKKKFQKEST